MDLRAFSNGDAFVSSRSSRSYIRDILTWAEALIDANKSTKRQSSWLQGFLLLSNQVQQPSIPRELSKAMHTIQSPHFPLGDDVKQQYAMALYRYRLPTESEMNKVTNDDTNTIPSVLETNSQKRTMVGHTGVMEDFYHCTVHFKMMMRSVWF